MSFDRRRTGYATVMSEQIDNASIADVATGDVITLDQDTGPVRVVHKDVVDSGFLVTVEADEGETFDVELPAGATVTRSLEAKWESPQSPTPHVDGP